MNIDIVLSFFCAFFAIMMVLSKKPIISTFYLLLNLISLSGIFFRLGSVTLAAIFLLIYGGAIIVFFLFILTSKSSLEYQLRPVKRNYYLIVGIAGIALFFSILLKVFNMNMDFLSTDKMEVVSNQELFNMLFTKYFVPFELVAILLLATTVSTILLAKRSRISQENR